MYQERYLSLSLKLNSVVLQHRIASDHTKIPFVLFIVGSFAGNEIFCACLNHNKLHGNTGTLSEMAENGFTGRNVVETDP